jgi:hypothetical protein
MPDRAAAEEHFRQALAATPQDSPDLPGRLLDLGLCLADRHARTGDADALTDGRRALQDACRLGVDRDASAALRAAHALGRWAERRRNPVEAAQAFDQGISVAHRLFATQLLRTHKEAWLRAAADVHIRAARNHLATPRPDRPAAVTALERGRALLLSETLAAEPTALDNLTKVAHADLVVRYRQAVARLSATMNAS